MQDSGMRSSAIVAARASVAAIRPGRPDRL